MVPRLAVAILLALPACSDGYLPPPPAWATECTAQVLYWVRAALAQATDPGYDYQHMALSDTVYLVERDVQTAALATQRTAGTAAADAQAQRDARTRCAAAASTRPTPGSQGGWP